MRRPALATPVAAAPFGPGYALSTKECFVVARRMAADDLRALDDDHAFDGDADLQQHLMSIDRWFVGMQARVARLPPRIGAESASLKACQAADHVAALGWIMNDDPQRW